MTEGFTKHVYLKSYIFTSNVISYKHLNIESKTKISNIEEGRYTICNKSIY